MKHILYYMQVLFFVGIVFSSFFLIPPAASYAEQLYTTEKLLTVDTGKQMLYAWENGAVVYSTPVSTGLYQTPTVLGTYKIYRKLPAQDMRGYSVVKGNYYLPNVEHVMYFYQGYAIHGTYWHSNFGQRMSNGCVNVSNEAAAWLYEWAPSGARVQVF